MNIQSPLIYELSLLDLMDYRNKEMSRTEIWVIGDPITTRVNLPTLSITMAFKIG